MQDRHMAAAMAHHDARRARANHGPQYRDRDERMRKTQGVGRYDFFGEGSDLYAAGRAVAWADPARRAAREEILREARRINPDAQVDFATKLVSFDLHGARAHGIQSIGEDGQGLGGKAATGRMQAGDRVVVALGGGEMDLTNPAYNWRVVAYHELWHTVQGLLTPEENAALKAVFTEPAGKESQDERNADAFAYWVTQLKAPKGNVNAAQKRDREDRAAAWNGLWADLRAIARRREEGEPGALASVRSAYQKVTGAFTRIRGFMGQVHDIAQRHRLTPLARLVSDMGLAKAPPDPEHAEIVRKVFEKAYAGDLYQRSRRQEAWDQHPDYAQLRARLDAVVARNGADGPRMFTHLDALDDRGRRVPALYNRNTQMAVFADPASERTVNKAWRDVERADRWWPHAEYAAMQKILDAKIAESGGKLGEGWMRYDIVDANGQRIPAVMRTDSNFAIVCHRHTAQFRHGELSGQLAVYDRTLKAVGPAEHVLFATAQAAAAAMRKELTVAGLNQRTRDGEEQRDKRHWTPGGGVVYDKDNNTARDIAIARARVAPVERIQPVGRTLRQEFDEILKRHARDHAARDIALRDLNSRYTALSGAAGAIMDAGRNHRGAAGGFGYGIDLRDMGAGRAVAVARNAMAKAFAGIYRDPQKVADLVVGRLEAWGPEAALKAIEADPSCLGKLRRGRLLSFGDGARGPEAAQAVVRYLEALEAAKGKLVPASAYALTTALQIPALLEEAGDLDGRMLSAEIARAQRGEPPGASAPSAPEPNRADSLDALRTLMSRTAGSGASVQFLGEYLAERDTGNGRQPPSERARAAMQDLGRWKGVLVEERDGALLAYSLDHYQRKDKLLAVASDGDTIQVTLDGRNKGLDDDLRVRPEHRRAFG